MSCCFRHVHARFLAAHRLPEPPAPASAAVLAAALPGTAAWLATARRQRLPAVEAAAASAASSASSASATSVASGGRRLPEARMRTGLADLAAARVLNPTNPTDLRTPAPAAVLECPVAPGGWRGAVRCGLVALVAGEVPLARVRVPLWTPVQQHHGSVFSHQFCEFCAAAELQRPAWCCARRGRFSGGSATPSKQNHAPLQLAGNCRTALCVCSLVDAHPDAMSALQSSAAESAVGRCAVS